MCGIVAYVGSKPVAPLLIEGLKRLEYRGYDSAGLASIADGRVKVARSVGRVSVLESLIGDSELSSYVKKHARCVLMLLTEYF